MNGTHVNKLLVGKGKTFRLNHTELISVFHQDFDVFLYIDWMCMVSLYSAKICTNKMSLYNFAISYKLGWLQKKMAS